MNVFFVQVEQTVDRKLLYLQASSLYFMLPIWCIYNPYINQQMHGMKYCKIQILNYSSC